MDQPTGNRRHFPALDGLRGCAVLSVLIAHTLFQGGESRAARALAALTSGSWAGVTLFFCLSGFLISGILIDTKRQRNWYRNFFARRSLRIFPLYFAFLAGYQFILPMWSYAEAHLPTIDPRTMWCYWVYLGNMTETLTGIAPKVTPLSPLWSLSVEEQVYLIWPFLIAIVPKKWLPRVFVILFAGSFIWKVAAYALRLSIDHRYAWTFACLDAFAAGGLVAVWSRDPATAAVLNSRSKTTALVSGALLFGVFVGQKHFDFWRNPGPMLTLGTTGVAIFCAAVIGIIVTSSPAVPLNRTLSLAALRWCGKYSYAAYVFHQLIVELYRPLFPGWDDVRFRWDSMLTSFAFSALVIATTFAFAWLSWHVWEKHFLSLKRYFVCSDSPPGVDVPSGGT